MKAGWYSISRMYNAYAEEEDFTMSMAYVLINLSTAEGVPSTQIAPMLGMESRSLTRVLKDMESQEIITKEHSLYDKRVVMVFLTKKGREYKRRAKAIIKRFNKQIKEKIGDEKLALLEDVMFDIIELSEQNNIENHQSD
jgi:DNA-binding MarR family transcriptional regulator